MSRLSYGGGAKECWNLLCKKYEGTAYVVLPQVANGTGTTAGRWLDAVVASLWPSRGLWLHGFEIKTSRHDWLRELKQGEKAQALYEHLDFFSILTAGPVIEPGELPETWGHVDANLVKKRLRTVKEAPRIAKPAAMDRGFVMSLLRSFDKTCISGDIATQLKAEFARGEKFGVERIEHAASHRRADAERNAQFFEAFQAAHELSVWSLTPELGERLGDLVKAFHAVDQYGGLNEMSKKLAQAREVINLLGNLPRPAVEKQ